MTHRTLFLCACIAFILTAQAEIKRIHIIQTADVHARLLPDERGNGGWLAVSTVIDDIKQRCEQNSTLLIDCGDTLQGTLAATLTKGMAALPLLHALGYNVWVPGNHEFDFGIPQFLNFMDATKHIALCANITVKGEKPFAKWKLFTRNNVKIAVIGIASSFQKNWLLPAEAEKIHVQLADQYLPGLIREITKHKPDVIVLAAHQGWFRHEDARSVNEINHIAQNYPEIDLILGAHTHRKIPGTRIGKKTWYIQPQAHASHVALVTMTVDTTKHEVVETTSMLLPVTKDAKPNPKHLKLVQPFIDRENAERKRILKGFLAEPARARGTPGVSSATAELIATAIAQRVHADVVFHGKLSNKDFPAGTVTAQALFDVVPYDNAIVTAYLTLPQIQRVLDEQLQWRDNYAFNGIFGVRTTLDANNNVKLAGLGKDKPLPNDPNTRLKVAFHSHAAAGSGRFNYLRQLLAQPESKTHNTGILTRTALETFLKNNPGYIPKTFKWLVK